MLSKKILKKIKEIEIKADALTTNALLGQHRSAFKGTGIEFSDLREYTPGDDIRHIAWRQSLKANNTYTKTYMEDRNLNIILMLDISSSGNFGSHEKFNAEASAELAACIAMSALKSGDSTGLVLFSQDIELFLPPQKNRTHISRIIREILYFKPANNASNFKNVLTKLRPMLPHSAYVLLLTDLWSKIELPELRAFSKQYELNVFSFFDSLETRLIDTGNISFQDLETKEKITINSSSKVFRKKYQQEMNRLFDRRSKFFKSAAIQHLFINNQQNIFLEMLRFYNKRKYSR